jgi:hypothetical protein
MSIAREQLSDNIIARESQYIGRVASATLFNTQLALPAGRAKLNGNGFKVNDSYDINHLLRENSNGELEVIYYHSAYIADLLLGHRAIMKNNSNPPQERPFVFIDTGGEVYRNMTLVHVQERRRRRKIQHIAIFEYPKSDGSSENGTEIIPIDDIYAINYAMPPELIPRF